MRSQDISPFTGRKMAAIMVGFFAVVIGVNVLMAREATATFGGVVVENSYVASQHYNRWLDEAAAEGALGWTARMVRRNDGHVVVMLEGPRATNALSAVARHPLGTRSDQTLQFRASADGTFVSRQALPADRWRLRLTVQGDGAIWRHEGEVR
jgi:nitrogen fixation protein FixH